MSSPSRTGIESPTRLISRPIAASFKRSSGWRFSAFFCPVDNLPRPSFYVCPHLLKVHVRVAQQRFLAESYRASVNSGLALIAVYQVHLYGILKTKRACSQVAVLWRCPGIRVCL
jgi:hypothetical protein